MHSIWKYFVKSPRNGINRRNKTVYIYRVDRSALWKFKMYASQKQGIQLEH